MSHFSYKRCCVIIGKKLNPMFSGLIQDSDIIFILTPFDFSSLHYSCLSVCQSHCFADEDILPTNTCLLLHNIIATMFSVFVGVVCFVCGCLTRWFGRQSLSVSSTNALSLTFDTDPVLQPIGWFSYCLLQICVINFVFIALLLL